MNALRTCLALLAVALLPLIGPGPALAQSAAPAASLSAEDRQDLRRIETYLNSFRSMQARFVQVTDDGRYSEGKLFFDRPSKMRFEYEPPIPILMVANRGQLIYYDAELEQVTYIPISATPLWFLTRDTIAFDNTVIVQAVRRGPGVLRVAMVQAEEPEAGEVELTFSTDPLELRKWAITDAEGVTINVALFNTRRDVALDPSLFEFVDPTFGQERDQ